MSVVRAASPDELANLDLDFKDERLKLMLPLYRARNFPGSLTAQQKTWWENFRRQKLLSGGSASLAAKFFGQIEELNKTPGVAKDKKLLLEELKDYAQAVLPAKD